jgi:hypothetical protein
MAYDQFASPSYSFLTLSKTDPHKLLPHKLLHLQWQLSLPGQCSIQLKQLYSLCCMVYKFRSSSMTLYRIWKTSGQYLQHKMNVIKIDVNVPVTRLEKQRHMRISMILRFTIHKGRPRTQRLTGSTEGCPRGGGAHTELGGSSQTCRCTKCHQSGHNCTTCPKQLGAI